MWGLMWGVVEEAANETKKLPGKPRILVYLTG
jgi:hypothetical protein